MTSSLLSDVTSPAERERMLVQMREASSAFYRAAAQIGNHPFIEFTGLINEYIKTCEAAHRDGVDFTQCNTHTGTALPLADFSVDYINEKLECIFTGRAFCAHPAAPSPDLEPGPDHVR